MRANKIEKLGEPERSTTLQYLNLRENQIATMQELLVLEKFPNLQSLNLNGNPVTEEKGGDLKKEIIIQSWGKFEQLKRLNKEEITAEELEEIKNERLERIKAAEEAAREAAEKAAAGEGGEANNEEGNDDE